EALMVRPFLLVALCALALFVPVAPARGQEKKASALKVGDPAPPVKATRWLQGTPIKKFGRGQVYVIEFWATWCGPCIAFMPHLAELQARHKGVTVIGLTAAAFRDTEEKAAAFVNRRGPALGYRFAFADGATFNAYMKAAGREGIPCTFVVDKTG